MTRNETPCPSCGEPILSTAKKCKHCGDWLDPKLKAERRAPRGGKTPPTVMALWGVAHMVMSGILATLTLLSVFGIRGMGVEVLFVLFAVGIFVLAFFVGRGLFFGQRWALTGTGIFAGLCSALCLYMLTQEPEVGVFFFIWVTIIYLPPLVSGFRHSNQLT